MTRRAAILWAECLPVLLAAGCWSASAPLAHAFSYIFAGKTAVNAIVHPAGYDGFGALLTVRVGIDPASPFASQMGISTQNTIRTWNELRDTTGNLVFGTSNNIPAGQFDFESVLLHEMGHALGLGHANLGVESGLSGASNNSTISTNGVNNVFDVGAGVDGVYGSADDVRGDDANLNYFRTANNNPFVLPTSDVIDNTTYSRQLAQLPAGDLYSANADRTVATLPRYGLANTEGVMQQGTPADEARRTLTADDVAGIRYAMSGFDEIQGNEDDYQFNLTYAGLTTDAEIVIKFDNSSTTFAFTSVTGNRIFGSAHIELDHSSIFFNGTPSWFFNNLLVITGDMDGDGDVDTFDIQPFELALANRAGYLSAHPALVDVESRGDVNGDGAFDTFDIQAFEALLTSGSLTLGSPSFGSLSFDSLAVPEPASVLLLVSGVIAGAAGCVGRSVGSRVFKGAGKASVEARLWQRSLTRSQRSLSRASF